MCYKCSPSTRIIDLAMHLKFDINNVAFKLIHLFLIATAMSTILGRIGFHGASTLKDALTGGLGVLVSEALLCYPRK